MKPTSRRIAVVAGVLVVGGIGVAFWLGKSGKSPAMSQAIQAVSSAIGASSASPDDGGEVGDAPGGDAGDGGPPRKRQAAPLSSAQLGAPLVNGHYVTACGAPDTMKVTVKTTVRWGKAVAVDVTTDPPDPGVRTCVEKFVRSQRWDISPKSGQMTVRY